MQLVKFSVAAFETTLHHSVFHSLSFFLGTPLHSTLHVQYEPKFVFEHSTFCQIKLFERDFRLRVLCVCGFSTSILGKNWTMDNRIWILKWFFLPYTSYFGRVFSFSIEPLSICKCFLKLSIWLCKKFCKMWNWSPTHKPVILLKALSIAVDFTNSKYKIKTTRNVSMCMPFQILLLY